MAIWEAIGLGVVIIVLRLYAPEVWNALEHVALSLLATLNTLADHLQAATTASPLLAPTF